MFATKGKATCMMRVITACVREKSNISIVRLLQNISIILGLCAGSIFSVLLRFKTNQYACNGNL